MVDSAGYSFSRILWAVRGSQLFLSTNDGQAWYPPRPVTSSNVFVLDTDHLWTVGPTPDSTWVIGTDTGVLRLIVSRSTDSGATWQRVKLPDNYRETTQRLVFVDPEHGFLLNSSLRFGDGRSTVLATTDGGATWHVTGSSQWLGSMFTASDAHTLWAAAEPEAGPITRPTLKVSRDGGATWQDAKLPGQPAMIGGLHWVPGPPVFFTPNNGIVAVGDGLRHVTTFYRTFDAGRTWQVDGTLHDASIAVPAIVDATDWLIGGNTGLWGTATAGARWVRPTGSGLPAGQIVWMGGGGSLGGEAALVSGDGGRDQLLYLTLDGGMTWRAAQI